MTPQNNMIFCTLFDSNYLDKGLALYESMKRNIADFRLYIFAFDDKCREILVDLQLKNVIVLSVDNIMTDTLQRIKAERTRAEFCWTCTSVIIEYVLQECKEKICTYIDADIYFFGSPEHNIQEIIDNGCSVGVVEHGFERDYQYGSWIFAYGRYCVQFNTFLNNEEGLRVLQDWKEECLNWCYSRRDDGKMGDQKYLDKWQQKFSCVYASHDPGVGAAPWNIHLYSRIKREKGNLWIDYKKKWYQLTFYHFEGMKYLDNDRVFLNLWKPDRLGIRQKTKLLYGEYFAIIAHIRRYLKKSYNISFEHMIVGKDTYIGNNYTLMQFCTKNGLFSGIRCWAGYWTNNIIPVCK